MGARSLHFLWLFDGQNSRKNKVRHNNYDKNSVLAKCLHYTLFLHDNNFGMLYQTPHCGADIKSTSYDVWSKGITRMHNMHEMTCQVLTLNVEIMYVTS